MRPAGVAGAAALQLDLSMRLFDTEDAQRAFAALEEAQEAGGDKSESEAGGKIAFTGR